MRRDELLQEIQKIKKAALTGSEPPVKSILKVFEQLALDIHDIAEKVRSSK